LADRVGLQDVADEWLTVPNRTTALTKMRREWLTGGLAERIGVN